MRYLLLCDRDGVHTAHGPLLPTRAWRLVWSLEAEGWTVALRMVRVA